MKNVHVLPTDKYKSSRLVRNGKELLLVGIPKNYTFFGITVSVNIYITSDEEIKERDWILDIELNRIEQCLYSGTFRNWKKIILTTDQDLIKDGIQAIDDEFLEWFVKNPSCEEVDTIYEPKNFFDIKKGWEYKIIIPKDYSKIKEGLEKSIKGKEHFVQHFKNGGTVEDFKPTEETCTCTDECLGYLTKTCKGIETLEQIDQNNPVTRGSTALLYKQETLEEAAKRIYPINIVSSDGYDGNFLCRTGFYIGYELAKERSYSEEEVIRILIKVYEDIGKRKIPNQVVLASWFEQFKKK